MPKSKWTYLVKVRFDKHGHMILRAKNGGGFWVKSVGGLNIPKEELDLQPHRRHDDA